MKISWIALLLFVFVAVHSPSLIAQKKLSQVSGLVLDENDKPLFRVSVAILGRDKGTFSNDSGRFIIQVPPRMPFALVFSFTGYRPVQRNFNLAEGEAETITIKLEPTQSRLEDVLVRDNRARTEAGRINIDPGKALLNPSPLGNIESLIKIFVGSNNELTSQYNVRGGSYDENLVYVNDFEVYRPYLVRSGQQEGLSFINPELTGNVKFYNGGFQAKYGDKMSSVLDVGYRKPTKFAGSAYFGLLEQGLHLEGTDRAKRFTYLVGVRNRSNRNLLSSQDTKGNYIPSSADLQALLTYQLSNKWLIEFLGNASRSKFTLYPEESKLSSAVFSPLFTANLALDIAFQGQEKDQYQTNMAGLSATWSPNKKVRLKWMLSRFENNEAENIDIRGAYLFGERDFDKSKATYGLIVNPLGAGIFQNFTRNKLDISVWNASVKGSIDKGKHFIQFGSGIDRQHINDKLHEWEYNDSAGYSLPYSPNVINLNKVTNARAAINITRLSGFIQDNIQFSDTSGLGLQLGVRYNYNTLNNELLVSPRLGVSFKPRNWKKDIIFRGAAGRYDQPPFYRELRRYDGTINEDLRAQKSWQVSAGFDYALTLLKRPGRITTELYYKHMNDVVPYDIDNVRLRYFGENIAKAYAAGAEVRLFGELVKDAESWVSIGFMKTKENLANDQYQRYELNDQNVAVDSTLVDVGYLRRPTDRTLTFGMFFQDYLSTNKNFKVYLNTLYGSNLPYNIPGSVRYRNALVIDPYIRIDLGLSALLLDGDKSTRRSHSPFRGINNIWASLEVFNLIDRPNTISYLLIKDFANNTFTLPNRLTPRLLNLKLVTRW
ncbi:TonB-dependent receptor [Segetibacter sp. 3557_3]|uniref:TonB-dependent receptor n=1 Tax=Segetibacter sp. 3557_3 TaxID=2547429 RepID=UPI001058EAB2|nr:TonB-dependent receptor [Segetibacter sp. 3557_3]TDH29106.1 TonB-dependent receptor [Segetibacter sp. 3557_3]